MLNKTHRGLTYHLVISQVLHVHYHHLIPSLSLSLSPFLSLTHTLSQAWLHPLTPCLLLSCNLSLQPAFPSCKLTSQSSSSPYYSFYFPSLAFTIFTFHTVSRTLLTSFQPPILATPSCIMSPTLAQTSHTHKHSHILCNHNLTSYSLIFHCLPPCIQTLYPGTSSEILSSTFRPHPLTFITK